MQSFIQKGNGRQVGLGRRRRKTKTVLRKKKCGKSKKRTCRKLKKVKRRINKRKRATLQNNASSFLA